VRFQFQVATTLVHELAHAYGNYVSEKCIACGGNEPYWDATERLRSRSIASNFPELGNSWEVWAFGSRMAMGGSIQPDDGEPTEPYDGEPTEPYAFQRAQWNRASSTDAGLYKYKVVSLAVILPVDYTYAWFQQAT
jgi:hypothetical protein